jgi:hypothetical protein
MAEIFARAQAEEATAAEDAQPDGPRLGGGGIVMPSAEPPRGFTPPLLETVEGTVLDADDPNGVRVERTDG